LQGILLGGSASGVDALGSLMS